MRQARSISPLVALVALALTPLVADAGHSIGPCGGGTGNHTITISPVTVLYLDDRGTQNATWLYQESNSVTGLQRGGHSLLRTDHCIDDPTGTPDTLLI
jgi:hypothetical protein